MSHLTDAKKSARSRSLFAPDNTVTDDQQAAPVHSGPPFFGFRAYGRSEPLGLMLALRRQVTRFGELLPISEWVTSDKTHLEHNESALTLIADISGDMDFRREGPRGDLSRCSNVRGQSCGYSITSSARASRLGATSRPSDLAVLRLITSSYLVGCCTGKSAGFSPLRMRST